MGPGLEIRPLARDEVRPVGAIVFKAFEHFARSRGEQPSFPSAEAASMWLSFSLQCTGFQARTAWQGEKPIGVMAMFGGDRIARIGPIVVDPEARDPFAALTLYNALLAEYRAGGFEGARGTVDTANPNAVALHGIAGATAREHFITFAGSPLRERVEGLEVRPLGPGDVEASLALSAECFGSARQAELRDAARFRTGLVALRSGALVGYSTGIGSGAHSAGRDSEALRALIASAPRFIDGAFNVPEADEELLRWCEDRGFTRRARMQIVTFDTYAPPRLPHLPSLYY